MSSVTAKERSSQTDDIRRIREEYEKKEADSTKRKNKELRTQSERYQKDIDTLEQRHDQELSDLRNKHSELISQRDEKHQNDIKEMREVYVNTLARKSEESQRAREEMQNTYRSDVDKQKQIAEQQKQLLAKGYEQSTNERERTFNHFVDNANKEVKKTIEDRTDKLKRRHQDEMTALQKDRDMRVGNLERVLDETKKTYKRDTVERKLNEMDQARAKDEHWKNVLNTEQHSHSKILEDQEKSLAAHKKWLGQDYREKIEQKQRDMDESNDNFRVKVMENIDKRVRAAKADKEQARNDRLIDMMTNRRIHNLEKEHLIKQHQDRVEALEKERGEIYSEANDHADKKIQEILHRNERLIQDVNRSNKIKQNVLVTQSKEDRDFMKFNHQNQLDQLSQSSEGRVKKIVKITDENQRVQQKYHENNLESLKNKYMENLQNQREVALEQLKDLYLRMEKRLKDTESTLQKKYDSMTEFYEGKIAQMEEKQQAEKQDIIKEYEIRSKNREKEVKMQTDSLEMKYQNKLAQVEEAQRKELERQERRHADQLQTVTNRAAAAYNIKKV
ncbi:MAG: hypothetical protein BroJett040_12530 [Oligoflexia bacterium]|nr:MAG: hypothetical protein BroJett040_12530 [Oligoflexia bacterium]